MLLKPSTLKRHRLTALTFVGLLLAFLLYLFTFVESKKDYFNERAFRVLGQMHEGLNGKLNTTVINAKSEVRQRLDTGRVDSSAMLHPEGIFNKNLRLALPFTQYDPAKDSLYSKIIYNGTGWVLALRDTARIRDITYFYKAETQLVTFFESVVVPGIFDDYFLVHGASKLHQDQVFPQYTIVYGDATKAFNFSKYNDSLSQDAQDQLVGGVPYKLFAHTVPLGNSDQLILCGLIKTKRYQSEVYAVPMFTIILLITVLVLLALGYPFLKLLIMDERERMRAVDAFFAVSSLIIGSFLFTLVLLSVYGHFYPDKNTINDDLKQLAQDINQSFTGEIRQAATQLQVIRDSLQKTNASKESLPENAARLLTTYPDRSQHLRHYPYYIDLFWIDSGGRTREMWTTEKYISPEVDVHDREYFRAITNDQPWKIDTHEYMLTPIFDRISGRNLAIIAAKFDADTSNRPASSKRPVFAFDTELYSVIDAVLPLGFGFCILDDQGKVWFHSDRRKNLQEAFLTESENNKVLRSALVSNSSTFFDLTYNGQEYQAYVRSVDQMPLHLITFHSNDYSNASSVLTLSLSFIYYLIALLPLCVLLLAQKFSFPFDFRLRGENSAFNWLRIINKHEKHYGLLAGVFLLVAIGTSLLLLWVGRKNLGYSPTVAVLSFNAIFTFSFARIILYRRDDFFFIKGNSRSYWVAFAGVLLLLNGVLLSETIKDGFGNQALKGEMITIGLIIGYQAVLLGLLLVALFWYDGLYKPYQALKSVIIKGLSPLTLFNLPAKYLMFLVSWIFIIGVLPSVFLYRLAYNQEKKIASQHYLMKMAQDITRRKNNIKNGYSRTNLSWSEGASLRNYALINSLIIDSLVLYKGCYTQGSLLPASSIAKSAVYFPDGGSLLGNRGDRIAVVPAERTQIKKNRFEHWIRNRFLYNDAIIENQHLTYSDNPSSHAYSDEVHNLCRLQFASFNLKNSQTDYLVLQATVPPLGKQWFGDDPLSLLMFLIIWVAVLYLMYSLGRFGIYRLFNLGLYDKEPLLPDSMKKIAEGLKGRKPHLYLTGLLLPEDNNFISKFISVTQKKGKEINKIDLRETKNKQLSLPNPFVPVEVVVFTHFEHLIYWPPQDIAAVLESIKHILEEGKTRILILSQQKSTDLLSSFLQLAEMGEAKDKLIFPAVVYSWTTVLNHFTQQYYHINISYDGPQGGPGGPDSGSNGTALREPFPWRKNNKPIAKS